MGFIRGGKPSWSRITLLFLLGVSIVFNFILWESAMHDDEALRAHLRDFPVYCEE
jgi:hypothetical protein